MSRTLLTDVRGGLRQLGSQPVVAIVAALSLGFGISASSTTASLARRWWLEPFPYVEQDRLAFLFESQRADGERHELSAANFLDWREAATRFSDMAAYTVQPTIVVDGGEPMPVNQGLVTENLFPMLGMSPALGRDLAQLDSAEQQRAVLLTHAFWQRHFGGRADVVGESLELDGVPWQVAGVLGEEFTLVPANIDVFSAADLSALRHQRDVHRWLALGRLSPGSSLEEAQAELGTIAERLEREYPDSNAGFGAEVLDLRTFFPGETDSKLMLILLTVAVFLLMLASANVANLLLSRATARRQEIALRSALGASRVRLLRQLLTESLVLAAFGAVAGIVMSYFLLRLTAGSMPAEMPRFLQPRMDLAMWLFPLLFAVFATFVFGTVPALFALRADVREALGDGSRSATQGRSRARLRVAFVVGELTVALVMLVGAGMMIYAFEELLQSNQGFRDRGLIAVRMDVPESAAADEAALARYGEALQASLAEVAGVGAVELMVDLPRSRRQQTATVMLPEWSGRSEDRDRAVLQQSVTPGLAAMLEIETRRGRAIGSGDRADTRPVMVVNESFERLVLGGPAVGRSVQVDGVEREIVGVVADHLQNRLPEVDGTASMIFVPFAQVPDRHLSFLVAAPRAEVETLRLPLRAAVRAVNPRQAVEFLGTLEDSVRIELAGPRVLSRTMWLWGVVGLLLSAIGVYGVVAQSVAERRHEIGIRIALGARPIRLVGKLVAQGAAMAACSVVLAVVPVLLLARLIRATLVGVGVMQPALIFEITVLLVAVAIGSSLLAARRASQVDPVTALNPS